MPKPKIVVCATAYYPYVGGSEITIQEVAKRLSGQFDFFILTARMSRHLPKWESAHEGTIVRLGFGAPLDKWFLPLLIPLHLSTRLSLVERCVLWGMDIGQGALGAATVKFLYPRIPFVLTVQYGESGERLWRGRGGLIRLGFRLMLGTADRVTAISRYLLGLARDFDYCGPAAVLHNGVDIEKFQIPDDALQTKHKTQNTKHKTIITVSRLVKKNGIDLLIRAFAHVQKEIPDALLHIIGDGPERDALVRLAGEKGVGAAVTFFGAVAHDALPEYLHAANIFVRPSRSEGMGNAFVEAMAAGLPVIGTSVGGIPDIIVHEKTGLLARPEDAFDLARQILRLVRDPMLAASIACAGREKATREFDWDAIAHVYGNAFQQGLEAKKRVVIATGLFPPEIGGPATYTKLLVDALPQRGIGLRVAPFRSVRTLPRLARHAAYFLKLLTACRGSDIIFAQDPVSVGLPAMLAARLTDKKFLLKIAGDYAWEQYRNEELGIRNQSETTLEEFQKKKFDFITEVRRAVQRFVARRAARIIVPSEYLKGIVMQWGVPEEHVVVIYNAFAPPRLLVTKTEARTALGIAPDTFFIVSAGRLVPWKGFGELIGALAVVQREIPKARLVIIGSGPDEDALRKKMDGERIGDIVSLRGSVSHEDTLRYLRAADLFILNSSYEGFSHTMLEAMAMEVPVMASDVGGNKEIITDGVNGRLYPRRDAASLADEIIRLYRDPQAGERFTREDRAGLSRFSTETLLASTAEIVFSL